MDNQKACEAFIAAQKNFGAALKTSTNPHFKSKYADLSACIEAVLDGLHGAGLALLQKNYPGENGVSVETLFLHSSGEVLSGGVIYVPAIKNDPQGFGSALTYARRYGLMSACGIAPEDDDGNAAAKAKIEAEALKKKAEDEKSAKEKENEIRTLYALMNHSDSLDELKTNFAALYRAAPVNQQVSIKSDYENLKLKFTTNEVK